MAPNSVEGLPLFEGLGAVLARLGAEFWRADVFILSAVSCGKVANFGGSILDPGEGTKFRYFETVQLNLINHTPDAGHKGPRRI